MRLLLADAGMTLERLEPCLLREAELNRREAALRRAEKEKEANKIFYRIMAEEGMEVGAQTARMTVADPVSELVPTSFTGWLSVPV